MSFAAEGTFPRDGVLVTCGGPFDQATSHYRDTIVVTAVPAWSTPSLADPSDRVRIMKGVRKPDLP